MNKEKEHMLLNLELNIRKAHESQQRLITLPPVFLVGLINLKIKNAKQEEREKINEIPKKYILFSSMDIILTSCDGIRHILNSTKFTRNELDFEIREKLEQIDTEATSWQNEIKKLKSGDDE